MRETGAQSRAGYLEEERGRFACLRGDREGGAARLREAHRLYTEMGATGHAERVAREQSAADSE